MKRMCALIIAVAFLISVSGCGDKTIDTTGDKKLDAVVESVMSDIGISEYQLTSFSLNGDDQNVALVGLKYADVSASFMASYENEEWIGISLTNMNEDVDPLDSTIWINQDKLESQEDEKKAYESFDDYAMDAFPDDGVCDVVSHETNKNDDGTYAWKLSVENVVKPDDLMLRAGVIGMALNPVMRQALFEGELEEISIASISIDGEDGAMIILLPPMQQNNSFACSFAARDGYSKKDMLEEAYKNSLLFQYDLQNSLNMAIK